MEEVVCQKANNFFMADSFNMKNYILNSFIQEEREHNLPRTQESKKKQGKFYQKVSV